MLAGVSLGKAKGFFTMLRSVSSLDAPAKGAAEVDPPNVAAADLADQAEIPEAQPPLVAKRVKRRIGGAVGLKRRRVLLRRARGEIKRQAAKARAVTVIATTHRTLTGIHALRNINLVGTTINNQMPKIREFKKNVWNKGMMNSEKGD
nr:hypothetical protein Iba_chr06cCG6330 [Ipomoea batatas]